MGQTTDGLADQLTDDTKAGEDKLAIQIDPNILLDTKGLRLKPFMTWSKHAETYRKLNSQ